MKKIVPVFLFFIVQVVFSQSPTITLVDPSSGNVGSLVNIYGSGFNSTYADNTVFFGGIKAEIVSGSSTQLVVKVPAGSNFQPITVTNNESKLTAFGNKPFNTTFITNNIISLAANAYGYSNTIDGASFITPVTGDLDGDGKTEIITAIYENFNAYKINILRNTSSIGSISFDESFLLSLTTAPTAVALGDLDGDGKLDMVVRQSDKITIFKNNSQSGTLSFASGMDITVSGNGNQIIIRDIGGYYSYSTAGVITNPSRTEGRPDIITFDGNTIKYIDNLSSNGNLSFASIQNVDMFFSNSNNITKIDITDIDNDGQPDFIASNGTESRIRLNRGININQDTGGTRSTINFSVSNVSFALPSANYAIAADIDGDNKLDLTNWLGGGSTILSVYRSQSSKEFLSFLSPLSTSVDVVGEGNRPMVIQDLSGDGKPDFIFIRRNITASNNPVQSFYLVTVNNLSVIGTILFSNNSSSFGNSGIPNPANTYLTTADLDGDGKPDVISTTLFQPNKYNSFFLMTLEVSRNTTAPLAPLITGFTPAEGAAAGNKITVSGSNFTEITQIRIGSTVIPVANYTINSTSQLTIEIPAGTSSGKIEITNRGGKAVSDTDFITIDPAGLISGTTDVCQNSQNVKYSVPVISGATSYEWVVPAGVSIVSGQNTREIVVNYSVTVTGFGIIRVRGVDNTYKGSFSPAFGFSILNTPTTPENLTAKLASSASVSLTWEDKSTNETDFYIYRAKNNDSTFVLLDKRNKDITFFLDNFDIQSGTTYFYKIVASNSDCLSKFSNTIGITTATPIITDLTGFSESNISIAPNPSDGIFEISFENTFNRKIQIDVLDIWGKTVRKETFEINRNKKKYILDMQILNPGIYFLTIQTEKGNIVKKIIIY